MRTTKPGTSTRAGTLATLGLGAMVALSGGPALAASTSFDGAWSVLLVCPDTQDRQGRVKGYDYRFTVSIVDGALSGAHGEPGTPASVSYVGTVADDGTVDITARGNTGRSDYAVTRPAEGSVYGYTLHGRLTATGGEAIRHEVRPCTATFKRR